MIKTVRYTLPYYHFSEGEAFDDLEDWLDVLAELLPGFVVSYEVGKRDKGYIILEKVS